MALKPPGKESESLLSLDPDKADRSGFLHGVRAAIKKVRAIIYNYPDKDGVGRTNDDGSEVRAPGLMVEFQTKGSDTSTSPLAWQTQDLEHMLLASRALGVPMIIGSSGDTGSNSRVDLFVNIIKDLAARHHLKNFKVGYFYSEVDNRSRRHTQAQIF